MQTISPATAKFLKFWAKDSTIDATQETQFYITEFSGTPSDFLEWIDDDAEVWVNLPTYSVKAWEITTNFNQADPSHHRQDCFANAAAMMVHVRRVFGCDGRLFTVYAYQNHTAVYLLVKSPYWMWPKAERIFTKRISAFKPVTYCAGVRPIEYCFLPTCDEQILFDTEDEL